MDARRLHHGFAEVRGFSQRVEQLPTLAKLHDQVQTAVILAATSHAPKNVLKEETQREIDGLRGDGTSYPKFVVYMDPTCLRHLKVLKEVCHLL